MSLQCQRNQLIKYKLLVFCVLMLICSVRGLKYKLLVFYVYVLMLICHVPAVSEESSTSCWCFMFVC